MPARSFTLCVCGDNRELTPPGSGNAFVPHTAHSGRKCPGIPLSESEKTVTTTTQVATARHGVIVVQRGFETTDTEISELRRDAEAAGWQVIVLPVSVTCKGWQVVAGATA